MTNASSNSYHSCLCMTVCTCYTIYPDFVFVLSHLDVPEYVKDSECLCKYGAIYQCEGYDTQPQPGLAQATEHSSGHQVGVNAEYDHQQVDKHNTHNEDHIQVWAGQTDNPAGHRKHTVDTNEHVHFITYSR